MALTTEKPKKGWQLGYSDYPEVYHVASKFHFPPEGPWILEEMTDFRTGPRNEQDKPENFEGPDM